SLLPILALFLVTSPPPPPALHSFPTRRSSDLSWVAACARYSVRSRSCAASGADHPCSRACRSTSRWAREVTSRGARPRRTGCARSEEHTSELQSRFDLVCRLLLETKNILQNMT